MQYLYILRNAPYQGTLARESLDMALATAAFDQKVQLLFMGDGVFNLLQDQNAELLQRKNIGKTLPALELYDINEVFVCKQALEERNLDSKDFAIEAPALCETDIQALINKADKVIAL